MRIGAKIVNEIAPTDIEHRPDRDERAETQGFVNAPIENRSAERAALTDERHTPGVRHVRREGAVEFRARRHHAETVRSDDAYALPTGDPEQFDLDLSTRTARFAEARADDGHGAYPCGRSLIQNSRDYF